MPIKSASEGEGMMYPFPQLTGREHLMKKEKRKAKRSSWRRHCQEINDVPGSARLMRIMAKQATNKVSTIRLPNGQYTQTGRETLNELFRVQDEQGRLEPGQSHN
jgi:hypothetical protein